MNPIKKKKPVDPARKSGGRQKDLGMLPIIPDLKYVSPDLLDEARAALKNARDSVVGVLANEKGQLSLFKDVTEEEDEEIPADRADEIIEIARKSLSDETGIGFEIRDGAVRIIRIRQSSDPWTDIGYEER